MDSQDTQMIEHFRDLSEAALTELTTEHRCGDVEDELHSFDSEPGPSVATKTELGARVMAVAQWFQKHPLLEDAGTNQDKEHLIRRCFVEGIPWGASMWDDWIEQHPSSPVIKPEWCAAFACYCVRDGYKKLGLQDKLPKVLSASTGTLREMFLKMDRFLKREEVFNDDGSLKAGAKLPGPGDIVLWQNHTGLLLDLFESGTYTTIEGNTRPRAGAPHGVYQLQNDPTRQIEKNGEMIYTLTGFCLLASLDGQ